MKKNKTDLDEVIKLKRKTHYRKISFINYLECDLERLTKIDQYYKEGIAKEDQKNILENQLIDLKLQQERLVQQLHNLVFKDILHLNKNIEKIFNLNLFK